MVLTSRSPKMSSSRIPLELPWMILSALNHSLRPPVSLWRGRALHSLFIMLPSPIVWHGQNAMASKSAKGSGKSRKMSASSTARSTKLRSDSEFTTNGAELLRVTFFHKISIEHLEGDNDKHQTWLAIHVQEGTPGIIGPIHNVSVWDIAVCDRGNTPALARGVPGALVSNVALRNVWYKDLGRAVNSLGRHSSLRSSTPPESC
ncbi:hypothetical protein D9615_008644 [Tricholomella constricta]|uniref:Uncharacterized protein n=1 Tax=Tricholomella constricta TaxID=117010 RepID=A0A8H5H4W7_9AGAR|nr:hypothetical protein D9615_008644 [Tricholomella constricta]